MQRLAANTGNVDPRLAIDWPVEGRAVWAAFQRMGRPASINGVESITNQEIQAYQSVRRVQFTEWELDIIEMFDAIAVELLNKK